MSAAALPAISAVGSLLGGSGLFKGKKTEMMNPMTPGAQRVSGAQENYIMGGLNKPIAYAGVNQASNAALDTIMRMFLGKSYTGGGPSYSAQGGGPQQGGYSTYGMPQQMGRQMPSGMPGQGGMPGWTSSPFSGGGPSLGGQVQLPQNAQTNSILQQMRNMTAGMSGREGMMSSGPVQGGGMPGMMGMGGGRPQQMGPQMPGGPFRGYYGR